MIEVRNDERGKLDEVVARGATVHLERLSRYRWCLIIEDRTERRVHLSVTTVSLVEDSSGLKGADPK